MNNTTWLHIASLSISMLHGCYILFVVIVSFREEQQLQGLVVKS